MADNAIEKLFEEMRSAAEALKQCKVESDRLREAQRLNNDKMNELGERTKLLERTLHKHIHEGLPIVQAKMQAHEDISDDATRLNQLQASTNNLIKSALYAYGPRVVSAF